MSILDRFYDRMRHRDAFTACPVLGHRTVAGEFVWQPEPAIVHEVLRKSARAWREGAVACQSRRGVGSHTVGDCARKGMMRVVHAHQDVGGLPAVGGIDIVSARRNGQQQVAACAQA